MYVSNYETISQVKFIKKLNETINRDIKDTEGYRAVQAFEDGNGRTGRLLLNYELMKANIAPVVIEKDDRVKYFEFLRNNDNSGLAEWLKELSTREEERMEKFGYR